MKSNYRKLGDFIGEVDRRNKEDKHDNLLGLSVAKCFIPSIANTVGTDFKKYKVIEMGQFAYIPDTSRRGDKIAIALLKDLGFGLLSNVYTVFEVTSPELLPEYLELWFKRPEFDRYARFKSHGSVREIFDWEQLCNVDLPVPSIENQRRIVSAFSVIDSRIQILEQLNDKLAALCSTYFTQQIRQAWRNATEIIETDLGVYPASWKEERLGDVIDLIIDKRGVTPKKLGGDWSHEGVLALSAKSIKNKALVNLDQARHVDHELYNRWMPEKLKQHDILMTSEAPLGEFYYLAIDHEYCLSQRLFALRANDEIILPVVLFLSLTDSEGLNQIDIRKTGTTVTGIRQSELLKVPIIVPDLVTQQRVALLCDPVMTLIEENSKEIAALKEIKTELLDRLGS